MRPPRSLPTTADPSFTRRSVDDAEISRHTDLTFVNGTVLVRTAVLATSVITAVLATGYSTGPSEAAPSPSPSAHTSRPAFSEPIGGPVPAKFQAASVTFTSDLDGWVLGTAPCRHKPCTSVLRTRDGGTTWRGIPAPRAPLAIDGGGARAVQELRFANRQDGFAVGPAMWITHDGGAHWRRQVTVAGIRHAVVTDVAATPAGVYALVSGTDTRYGGSDGHFRLIRAAAHTGRFRIIKDFGKTYGVGPLVTAGSTVYLVRARLTSQRADLVRVRGTRITHRRLPAGCSPLAASTPRALLVECGSGESMGAMGSRSLKGSTDAGATWHRLRNPGAGGGYLDEGIVDAGHGHAILGTGDLDRNWLLNTTDGGRTWHAKLKVRNATFTELGCEDVSHCVVIAGRFTVTNRRGANPVYGGALYRTTNAGRHWRRVRFA